MTDGVSPTGFTDGVFTGDLTVEGTLTANIVGTNLAAGPSYDDDVAAAAGGVAIGELYRNGNFIMVRIS